MTTQRIIPGDCVAGLQTLPDASVHCCVTSPPYWGLRDYGHEGQIGLEQTPEEYVARMVEVFREVRRVLRNDGACWLNLGDSYSGAGPSGASYQSETTKRRAAGDGNDGAFRVSKTLAARGLSYAEKKPVPPPGLKPKDLVGIPWRVAFALQADGWWLRQDIIWHKPNPMPESVTDRCTKAHEYVFLLTKSQRYFYDAEAVSETSVDRESLVGRKRRSDDKFCSSDPEGMARTRVGFSKIEAGKTYPTRNRRSVWTITTKLYSGAHFAVMPADLVEPCVKAGTSEEGCCPHCGAPWERVVERETVRQLADKAGTWQERPGAEGCAIAARSQQRRHATTGLSASNSHRSSTPQSPQVTTTGWRPTCDCPSHQPVPCTVLDPFAGSGTTLAGAAELGRSGIGCELNPEYIALAERRIKDARASVALFEGACA